MTFILIQGFGGRLSENGIEVVLPPIVFSKLKKVTFGSFKGDEMELILAEFFLKNAKILESMVIYTCFKSQEKKMRTMERMLLFQRRSPKCKIVFSDKKR